MCTSSPPKIDKVADAPAAPLDPPEPPLSAVGDGPVASKRRGRKSLRIDLAAGNTSMSPFSGPVV